MRFGWLAFVIPFLYVASPTLLMRGDPLQIIIDLITALAGVWLVCVGMVGYFVRLIGPLKRLIFAIAGLALLSPAKAFVGGVASDPFGLVLGVILVVREIVWRRRLQRDKGA